LETVGRDLTVSCPEPSYYTADRTDRQRRAARVVPPAVTGLALPPDGIVALLGGHFENWNLPHPSALDQEIYGCTAEHLYPASHQGWVNHLIPWSVWTGFAGDDSHDLIAVVGRQNPKEQLRTELIEPVPHKVVGRRHQ